MKSVLNIEAVVADGNSLGLTNEEVKAILAIIFLAVGADHRMVDEELDAFERTVHRLSSHRTLGEVDDLLDGLSRDLEKKGQTAMLAEATSAVGRQVARDHAYKLAYLMSLADIDTNEDEFLFDEELRENLQLTEDEAEHLMDEVLEAIDAGAEDRSDRR